MVGELLVLIVTYQEDPVYWFNHTTFLCLSQARTWISNVICCCYSLLVFSELRWEAVCSSVDIGGIVDHHCWYWWNCWPSLLILVELLTITWYWWNCWPSLFKLSLHNYRNFSALSWPSDVTGIGSTEKNIEIIIVENTGVWIPAHKLRWVSACEPISVGLDL